MRFIRTPDPIPAQDTQGYTLLALTGICGEFPADLLSRLPGGERYKALTVSALKGQGFLRTYYRDRLRGYRLGRRAKALLCTEQPERFSFFLQGGTDTNHLKSEVARRLRLHRIAAVTVLMQNAGVHIFRDEKPDIFAPDGFDGTVDSLSLPAFYSSREVKAPGADTVKIRGSRMAGVLLAPSGIFPVYGSGLSPPAWDHRAEQRARAWLSLFLCRERLPKLYAMRDIHGLLVCDSMEPLARILSEANTKNRCLFLLDGDYDCFYCLTNDHRGDVLLRLLCEPERRAKWDKALLAELDVPSRGLPVEYDALDANGRPVLFAYLPDVPRLGRFLAGLSLHGLEGCIVCFDFQARALKESCGKNVSFLPVSFEKFERRFCP